MTTKQDFTTEEWNLLTLAPVHVSTCIVAADPSVVGAIKEVRAMAKFVEQTSPPEGAYELVAALRADLEAKGKNKEELATLQTEEGEDPVETARQGLQQVAALLDTKCSPEEAAAFKQWLADAAQAAAAADKEGGFLGIGGKHISDKEQAALAELDTILNR